MSEKSINERIKESLQRRGGKAYQSGQSSFSENRSIKSIDSKRVTKTSAKNFSPPSGRHRSYADKRTEKRFLTQVRGRFTKIKLPDQGAFNAGIEFNKDKTKIIMVYRENENNIKGCLLDRNYNIIPNSFHNFNLTRSADPRLIWTPDGKLLMVYSYYEGPMESEHMVGMIIMDSNSESFVTNKPFRISPSTIKTRQKNWIPFVNNGKIYLIASIFPHIVYELKNYSDDSCEQVFETIWSKKWYNGHQIRGNTPPVLLDNGTYLNTFHTVQTIGNIHYYDNGCYIFSGKEPFNVMKCGTKTYLPAESACERHFRKADSIICNFPVGMLIDGEKIIISYGDNDSSVKIMETTLKDMLETTTEV